MAPRSCDTRRFVLRRGAVFTRAERALGPADSAAAGTRIAFAPLARGVSQHGADRIACILGAMTERIWAPWRTELFQQPKEDGCIFCKFPGEPPAQDEKNLLVHRGDRCFVILNRFPYTAGHLMVIPYEHTDDVSRMAVVASEMFGLAQRSMDALVAVMKPEGFNLGMNLGKVAGAGIPGHGHLHVVPRWNGDNNFMAVLADRRVINEGIEETWRRLKPRFT